MAATKIAAKDLVRINLRRLREAAGLTQVELANASGIPQPRISFIEREGGNVEIDTMQKLADALGVPPKSFLEDIPE